MRAKTVALAGSILVMTGCQGTRPFGALDEAKCDAAMRALHEEPRTKVYRTDPSVLISKDRAIDIACKAVGVRREDLNERRLIVLCFSVGHASVRPRRVLVDESPAWYLFYETADGAGWHASVDGGTGDVSPVQRYSRPPEPEPSSRSAQPDAVSR